MVFVIVCKPMGLVAKENTKKNMGLVLQVLVNFSLGDNDKLEKCLC